MQWVVYFLLDDAESVQIVAAMQCDKLCISCNICDCDDAACPVHTAHT